MIKIKNYSIVGSNFAPKIQINPADLVDFVSTSSDSDAINKLDENVDLLKKDVAIDACYEDYNEDCKGFIEEVDDLSEKIRQSKKYGTETDLASVLEVCEVDPTDSNVATLGKCIKSKAGYPSVSLEDISLCVLSIKKGSSLSKAHTNKSFRDQYYSWHGSFKNFKERVSSNFDWATSKETQQWISQFNEFRSFFIKSGGKTSSLGVNEPPNYSKYLYWTLGIGVALAGFYVLSSGATTVAAIKSIVGKEKE